MILSMKAKLIAENNCTVRLSVNSIIYCKAQRVNYTSYKIMIQKECSCYPTTTLEGLGKYVCSPLVAVVNTLLLKCEEERHHICYTNISAFVGN